MLRFIPTLLSAVSTDIEKVVRRKRRNLIGYCVAVLFALTAYFAGVMALVSWLMQFNDPLISWLVVAILAMSVALLVIASIMTINYVEKRKKSKPSNTATTASMIAASQISSSKNLSPLIISVLGIYFAWSKMKSSEQEDT
jgi:chromate transport protein ChrA